MVHIPKEGFFPPRIDQFRDSKGILMVKNGLAIFIQIYLQKLKKRAILYYIW